VGALRGAIAAANRFPCAATLAARDPDPTRREAAMGDVALNADAATLLTVTQAA
jgi:hypothetical protein